MTDATDGATAAPPKKRSFFKKAAWQTKPKPEGGIEQDIFSHSNEFKDIVAEETKRKREQKRLKDEEKKRKEAEHHERKRRKVSLENEDMKLPGSPFGGSPRASRTESKARSRTPLSPLAAEHPLGARYDSITKSSSSADPGARRALDIIDLGDLDPESDDSLYKPPKPTFSQALAKSSIPHLPSQPEPVDELEEIEDPMLAALAAKARARAANKSTSSPAINGTSSKDAKNDAIVQLLITSEIPDTEPLFIKIKTSTTLEKPRTAWCRQQNFSPELTRTVFFTWKHKKVFDSTTVKRLGINIDENGIITVEGATDLYTEDNLPKIHIEAWTEVLFQQWQRRQVEEAEAKRKAAELPPVEERESEPKPGPQTQKIRLFLKAKGKADFRIGVHSDTTVEHLTLAYKKANKVPDDQPITLMFDGERMRPMDTIQDAGVEDMEVVEVYFK